MGSTSARGGGEVAASTHAALLRVLERHGRSLDGANEESDALLDE